MKPSRVFWGIFFVVTGLALLLEQTNVLRLPWWSMWRFWPVVLIIWGLSALSRNRMVKLVAAGLLAIAVALFAVSALTFAWTGRGWGYSDETITQDFTEPFDPGIRRASLFLEAAAGSYRLDDTTAHLFSASTKSSFGGYRLYHDKSGSVSRLRFFLDGTATKWNIGTITNHVDLQLNTNPAWEMDLDAGAASIDFDLSRYKLETLRLDAGAASVRLRLGALSDETRVRIDAGASSMRIAIPEEAGSEIRLSSGLSSKDFRDFTSVGSDTYRTENFARSTKKIYFDIDAGMSSLKVTRY